jgi:DNA polymerase IV
MTDAPCILFVDCDRFYFAVEVAESPELAEGTGPIIIGHDPRRAPRAIVTTANNAARALGIHSGMSAARALRLAPDAMFLPPRHELYQQYSRRVMAVLRDESPLVQQNSIDEAACQWPAGFLAEPAVRLRMRIWDDTGISVSIGVASSQLVAKMASEDAKRQADHVRLVLPGDEADFLAPLDVRSLIGVGPKAEKRLRAIGIQTIGDLTRRSLTELVGLFGRAHGQYLFDSSRGIDNSPLRSERAAKSVSEEHTFDHDTADRQVLWNQLRRQSAEISARLRGEGLEAREIGIKLRYANWETVTRQTRIAIPTDDGQTLSAAAAALMRRHWDDSRSVRLIGLRAGHLAPKTTIRQLELLEGNSNPRQTNDD